MLWMDSFDIVRYYNLRHRINWYHLSEFKIKRVCIYLLDFKTNAGQYLVERGIED